MTMKGWFPKPLKLESQHHIQFSIISRTPLFFVYMEVSYPYAVDAFSVFYIIQTNQNSAISLLNGKSLKLVDQFIYLINNISSIESNVYIHIGKEWIAINRLLTIWKYDLSDEIKWDFFQVVAVSLQLHHLNFNEMPGKKAWLELCKNNACCFEQILEVAPYKTVVVWLFTSHLTNHLR